MMFRDDANFLPFLELATLLHGNPWFGTVHELERSLNILEYKDDFTNIF